MSGRCLDGEDDGDGDSDGEDEDVAYAEVPQYSLDEHEDDLLPGDGGEDL